MRDSGNFNTKSRLSRPFFGKRNWFVKWLTRFRNEIFQSCIWLTIQPNRKPTGFSMRWSTVFFTNKTFYMSVAPTSRKIRTSRNYDGDANRNAKKAIGLTSKMTTLHVQQAFSYISYRPCITRTWNDPILSLLGNGNCKAINSTISVRTRARSLLFSFNQNSLLLSNWVHWNKREK